MLKRIHFLWIGLLMVLTSACNNSVASPTAVSRPPVVQPTVTNMVIVASISEISPQAMQPAGDQADACVKCHTDQQMLMGTARPVEEIVSESQGESWRGDVAPLEPWRKVLVDQSKYIDTVHGQIACTTCHSGNNVLEKEKAHTGLIPNPGADPHKVCGNCHPNVVVGNENGLHTNLAGFWTALKARSLPSRHPALEKMYGNHCSSCHATCGECHVSQPRLVGGGFIKGHVFNRQVSMTQNCVACHGSRVGKEYLGKMEGSKADVHYSQGQMDCQACHGDLQMHGQPSECSKCHRSPEKDKLPPPDHRYAGVQSPRCETCHVTASTGQDGVIMHQMHDSKLSCQVCHVTDYTNCDGCHVGISQKTGQPFYEIKATYSTFLIGRNPIPSFERPYQYVPVRHAPIAPDSFDFYGADLLPNFNQLETWKYATPHNIQRKTPQTESCNACHGNLAVFLTVDKVNPDEQKANRNVIVKNVPPPIGSADQLP